MSDSNFRDTDKTEKEGNENGEKHIILYNNVNKHNF